MKTPEEISNRVLNYLSGLPPFQGVSPGSLSLIARESLLKKLSKGSFIFFRGDKAEAVYLVCEGVVLIHIESLDGRELVINEIHAGEFFGELGVITGQPHSANAEIMEDSEVLVIPGVTINRMLEKEVALALYLLKVTASRLQASSRREESLAFFDARERLARLLLVLDQQERETGFVTLSQEELAQRTGLTRQTVAAVLGDWRRNGWLLTGRGHIMLLNRGALNLVIENLDTNL